MNRNNVNDNVNSLKKNNNLNLNDNDNKDTPRPRDIRAQRLASFLVDKFDNQQWYEYYLKVGYNLSEYDINRFVDIAFRKGKNPAKYFSYLCNREMA